jgi:hypothetical protein
MGSSVSVDFFFRSPSALDSLYQRAVEHLSGDGCVPSHQAAPLVDTAAQLARHSRRVKRGEVLAPGTGSRSPGDEVLSSYRSSLSF